MDRNDDLRAEITKLEDTLKPGVVVPGGADTRTIMGFGTVAESVIRLEETSYFLAWVNIIVGVLILLFAGLQIYIMLHQGH